MENLIRNNYFDILRHVAEALFEVYCEEELDPYIIKQMIRLKDSLSRELTVQKQVGICYATLIHFFRLDIADHWYFRNASQQQ